MIAAGRVVGERFGSPGAIAGAAVAGLFNLDVITVSMARLVPEPLSAREAAVAIMTAVATDAICRS